MPAHTGQTAVFGAAWIESTTGQPQNIFDAVCSSAWTSMPMTGSYSMLFYFARGNHSQKLWSSLLNKCRHAFLVVRAAAGNLL
jgi:hypothetical protein